MSLVHDRCICLRKLDYSETSQILLIFGRMHGLVRVIAKGAHRKTKAGASKFGGGIDLLDVAEAVFSDRPEKNLSPLCEWTLVEGNLVLRGSLRGLYLACYAAELVSLLIEEHDPHANLFDALERLLPDLGTERAEQAFLNFELALLRETGYLPQLTACVACERPLAAGEPAFFSPAVAGVVCRDCEAGLPDRLSIDRRLIDMVQYFLRLTQGNGHAPRLPMLTRRQTDPINRILADHVQHTTGRRLRVLRYVT